MTVLELVGAEKTYKNSVYSMFGTTLVIPSPILGEKTSCRKKCPVCLPLIHGE